MTEVLEEFEKRLKGDGLKLTDQRRMVVQEALSLPRHFSAEDLLAASRKHHTKISTATVYRTLALLVSYNILEEHDFGTGSKQYEQATGVEHHDHLVCLRCGKIVEFRSRPIEKAQDQVADEHKFLLLTHSHKLFGLCQACQK